MSEYKLMGIYKISGQIKLETGLHIGGDEGVIEIGGNDNPIVRDITTENPYIPGSSLKGKMRYLLEWYTGKVTSDGKVYDGKNLSKDSEGDTLLNVFGGTAGGNGRKGPTRITVKDIFLSEDSEKEVKRMKERTGTDTELKIENSINRLDSSANPRNLERVPRNLIFDMEINFKVLNIDKKDEIEKIIKDGLKLVEIEGLGGAVSRGSGQIKFEISSCFTIKKL
ncbi:type III-A CRISPR-associated RAMP protein Csm3 [uncultured Leptotrichia sp.]|uniref:type III-A CRISPR-associated RAMP protein Csm3 n=1 Tax=uncultured Leptotrichia sp. TaxID=159271 RepID=UPI0025E1BB20|nr:type III-A CRISPR-associated RAMP protein Csm3 [uncultured Leptotrichia sp.]